MIPSVAVPLSLIGTFGVMYVLGYSLNNLTLMAALQAALEFRHDHSWMHGGILRAQTDSVTSSQGWIVADPTLGAPMYRFLVHSLRDAYTAGKIPIPDEVRAALRSYP